MHYTQEHWITVFSLLQQRTLYYYSYHIITEINKLLFNLYCSHGTASKRTKFLQLLYYNWEHYTISVNVPHLRPLHYYIYWTIIHITKLLRKKGFWVLVVYTSLSIGELSSVYLYIKTWGNNMKTADRPTKWQTNRPSEGVTDRQWY